MTAYLIVGTIRSERDRNFSHEIKGPIHKQRLGKIVYTMMYTLPIEKMITLKNARAAEIFRGKNVRAWVSMNFSLDK